MEDIFETRIVVIPKDLVDYIPEINHNEIIKTYFTLFIFDMNPSDDPNWFNELIPDGCTELMVKTLMEDLVVNFYDFESKAMRPFSHLKNHGNYVLEEIILEDMGLFISLTLCFVYASDKPNKLINRNMGRLYTSIGE